MSDYPPVPGFVLRDFAQLSPPRRGIGNPQDMTNPVWLWLIETGYSAYLAAKRVGLPDRPKPGWSFQRFGQSETTLADGSTVFIGGEHEDFYDPDFYIYNDVILRRPDGSVTIYGYAETDFPPTDFHSATRVGDRIILIGGLRYHQSRVAGETWVFALNLSDFSIERLDTKGTPPSWLFDHSADLQKGRILCDGGTVTHVETGQQVESFDQWALDLKSLTWERTRHRPARHWRLQRSDGTFSKLHNIDAMARARRGTRKTAFAEKYAAEFRAFGHEVDLDLYDSRHAPPLPHIALGRDQDSYSIHRIEVDGVTIRIAEDYDAVTITIIGTLPDETIATLLSHYHQTYAALEGVPYRCTPL